MRERSRDRAILIRATTTGCQSNEAGHLATQGVTQGALNDLSEEEESCGWNVALLFWSLISFRPEEEEEEEEGKAEEGDCGFTSPNLRNAAYLYVEWVCEVSKIICASSFVYLLSNSNQIRSEISEDLRK